MGVFTVRFDTDNAALVVIIHWARMRASRWHRRSPLATPVRDKGGQPGHSISCLGQSEPQGTERTRLLQKLSNVCISINDDDRARCVWCHQCRCCRCHRAWRASLLEGRGRVASICIPTRPFRRLSNVR